MNCVAALQSVFWVSAAALAYTFPGYPFCIRLLAGLFPHKNDAAKPAAPPEVCAVLVAYNEQDRIAARIENLLSSDYPNLRVLAVSDGSSDATVERISAMKNPRVQCIKRDSRSGKSACLNIGVAQSKCDILVFCDARQNFATDAISRLVSNFSNPQVGAVSGSLSIDPSRSSVGEGVDAYWKLEKKIRAAESHFDSSIGCTGAIYAIRRELFEEIPGDTLLDDVVIPMQIALKKRRVIFDGSALACDPQSLEPGSEMIRKKRTLAGNFQMLFRYPGWLLPWRNRLWWQLISHKYLRVVSPMFLLLALGANLLLASIPLYRELLLLQGLFYLLAITGMALPSLKFRLFSFPAGFLFLNIMTLRGLLYYLFPPVRNQGWESRR